MLHKLEQGKQSGSTVSAEHGGGSAKDPARLPRAETATMTLDRAPLGLGAAGENPRAEADQIQSHSDKMQRGFGLSAKLLFATIAFIMLAEVLIFVPSVANFRVTWLKDRLVAAQLAALAADAVKDGEVPDSLRKALLATAQVRSIAVKRDFQRRLVLMSDTMPVVDEVFDLHKFPMSPGGSMGFVDGLGHRAILIWDALCVFFYSGERELMVRGQADLNNGNLIEIVLPEAPLKAAMIQYGINVLLLSIVISIFTAALVYWMLNWLLVRPIRQITLNMCRFSEKPEDTSRIITPSSRTDEVGVAERELANMQSELNQMLHQKSRLAALGLAVSKINHDLRNMLASAQLISDRLGTLPDPTVQRFAPKLIASLDRAITFCNDSLQFGRTQEMAPRRDLLLLKPLLLEVGDGLGLPRTGCIDWRLDVDEALCIDADRDQLYRVLSNLCRNAVQALEAQHKEAPFEFYGQIAIRAWRDGRQVSVEIADNGPGIDERTKASLFKAFQGSTRKGGSGLGLAIAHELIGALGGDLVLVEVSVGTTFRFTIPDRVV